MVINDLLDFSALVLENICEALFLFNFGFFLSVGPWAMAPLASLQITTEEFFIVGIRVSYPGFFCINMYRYEMVNINDAVPLVRALDLKNLQRNSAVNKVFADLCV